MFPRPKPASQNRQAYIPPAVQQALAQHAQQAMPAHLKKYQDGRAFIPTHAENAIKQHMQKSVPAHMKEYVGAYVEQNMVFQGGPSPKSPNAAVSQGPRPVAMAHPPSPPVRLLIYTRSLQRHRCSRNSPKAHSRITISL